MTLTICLIGAVPKGDAERTAWIDWKTAYKKALAPLGDVMFVDGDVWRDETKSDLLFGHDASVIKQSDIIIANAEEKLGCGTAQEMVIAKYFGKPLFTILPKDTHHRKTNIMFDGVLHNDWIHPFIRAMSDEIVEDVSDCGTLVRDYQKNHGKKPIKTIRVIDEAIEQYQKAIHLGSKV
ncbi:MAG: hypothetical protein HY832_00645 [Candidatus Aenigmarchaeota archaeon]|nr:hypothetical protein [Candidatus Aenigmarchaeota archaeon]